MKDRIVAYQYTQRHYTYVQINYAMYTLLMQNNYGNQPPGIMGDRYSSGRGCICC